MPKSWTSFSVFQRTVFGVMLFMIGLGFGLVISHLPAASDSALPSLPAAPVIEPSSSQSIEEGTLLTIRARAEGASSYEWKIQGDGKIEETTADVNLYTAPSEEGGVAVVTVVSHNHYGDSLPTSLIINVVPPITVRLDAVASDLTSWVKGTDNPDPFISAKINLRGCHTGEDCQQFTYKAGMGDGGIRWSPWCLASAKMKAQDHAQDSECNINVLTAGNLSTAKQLTFWARGDLGKEVIIFRVGGADVSPKPGRSLGRVTLTPAWKQYEINLEGIDLTSANCLFIWQATDIDNPQGVVFYLDDVQIEGVKK